MSERRKPHNGRDKSGHFKVKRADYEDLGTDPDGRNVVRADVRLCGAVEDTGPTAGRRGEYIAKLVEMNREDISRLTGQPVQNRKR